MVPTGFHPVFLFLAWLRVVAGHVEPPTNVTLHCHNLHNVLKWGYARLLPGLKFRVTILSVSSFPDELWVDPPTLHADVSFLSDPSNDYNLAVTAVIGHNESDEAPQDGITFSYFKDSAATKKCLVDLPQVNVTAQPDDNVLFRFTHPWLWYHQKLPGSSGSSKPRRKKSRDAQISQQLPLFSYSVVMINQNEQHHDFSCVESVCEGKLPVDASQQKHCLRITGELQKMSVRGTQEYCALPFNKPPHEPNNNTYIYIVVSVLALSAVAFVLCMVYKKTTKPSTPLPNSMTFSNRLKQWTLGVVQEPVFVPEVEPHSPTPLLSTTEEKEFTPAVTSSTQHVLRLPIGVSTEDEGVCDVVEVGNDKGHETSYSSEIPSGYEKRQVVVELAPDEHAEGYRG